MPGEVLRHFCGQLWSAWVTREGVRIIQQDGSETFGAPPGDSHFLESARSLGYGDDVYWHMVEHDLLHAYLAERLDGAPSAALWGQAHDANFWRRKLTGAEKDRSDRDEFRVGAVQAALNGIAWGFERLNGCIRDEWTRPTLVLDGGSIDGFVHHVRMVFRNPEPMTCGWAERYRPLWTLPAGPYD
jgi:hypothetical protein